MNEVSDILPASWELVKLGNFVENEKGKKPKRQKTTKDQKFCFPYIDIEAFEKGVFKSYTDGDSCRFCSENDFLMLWDGSRSGLVGKGINGALGSTLVRINFPHIVNDYAYYFLKSKYLQINSRAKGSGTPHVDPDLLWNYNFPIPPGNEQARIVEKIEELFSELDKGIESLKTAREQLKVYRQALLKHAFEGKLTEQWRKDNADKLETADQLLSRIQQERETRYQQQLEEWEKGVKKWEAVGKEGKKPSKPSKLVAFSAHGIIDNENLPALPKGWEWFHLSDVVERIQIGPFGSLLHKHDYIQGGKPLINPSHIKDMAIVPDYDLTISNKKLSELEKYVMSENDIVIGRRGEMGRCAVVKEKEDSWLCGTGSLFVRLLQSLDADFYCHILSSRRVKDYLSGSSIGTTMQNLNQKILQSVPVPVCSYDEQIEIVSNLNRQFSVIDNALKVISENLLRTETLRQSILKKAFSGQLVAQDSNDEPASALLKRIAAEKEEVTSKKSKRVKNKSKVKKSTAKVLPFKTQINGISTTDLHAGIMALAYQYYESSEKAIHNFGHVKGEKIVHLVEAHLGIDLARNPVKDAAGPNDYPHLMKVESRARKAGFFDMKRKGARYILNKGRQFDTLITKSKNALGNRLSDIEDLLELMKPLNTRQSEIVATLYAAWNNLLLTGAKWDDEAIVYEARENWHKNKLNIEREKFFNGLIWMREQGLLPHGKGEKVIAKNGNSN